MIADIEGPLIRKADRQAIGTLKVDEDLSGRNQQEGIRGERQGEMAQRRADHMRDNNGMNRFQTYMSRFKDGKDGRGGDVPGGEAGQGEYFDYVNKMANKGATMNTIANTISGAANAWRISDTKNKDFYEDVPTNTFTPINIAVPDVMSGAVKDADKAFNSSVRALTESGHGNMVAGAQEVRSNQVSKAAGTQNALAGNIAAEEAKLNQAGKMQTDQTNAGINMTNASKGMEEEVLKETMLTNQLNGIFGSIGNIMAGLNYKNQTKTEAAKVQTMIDKGVYGLTEPR
jgi:hypothetical protein